LKESENKGKKTKQSRVLNWCFLFIQTETGGAAKNGNSSYRYRKCLSSKTFSCCGVSLKVLVKVSM